MNTYGHGYHQPHVAGLLWSDGYAIGWNLAAAGLKLYPVSGATASFADGRWKGYADFQTGAPTMPPPSVAARTREAVVTWMLRKLDKLTGGSGH